MAREEGTEPGGFPDTREGWQADSHNGDVCGTKRGQECIRMSEEAGAVRIHDTNIHAVAKQGGRGSWERGHWKWNARVPILPQPLIGSVTSGYIRISLCFQLQR